MYKSVFVKELDGITIYLGVVMYHELLPMVLRLSLVHRSYLRRELPFRSTGSFKEEKSA